MVKFHFECRPEECLLHVFNVLNNDMEHHNGRGQVCRILSENNGLVGLVDEDPDALHHPYYLKLYSNFQEEKYNIRVGFDKEKNNKLIILKPKFEDWLVDVVSRKKLKMEDFNLSSDPDELHGEINFKITKLQTLLHQLLKNRNKEILFLKTALLK